MDIFADKFIKKQYRPSKPTKKAAFIGGSHSGKTTNMINYFIHIINDCCAVVIIAPLITHQDEKKLVLKEWCEDAGMPIYFCTASSEAVGRAAEHSFTKVPKFPAGSVYIVDDCYTSTDRDKEVEHLVKHLVNVGRHDGIHILYAAHLPIHLPSEIKYNCDHMFIHSKFAVIPDTYDRLALRDASQDLKEKAKNNDKKWYLYDDTDLFKGKVNEVVWPVIKTRNDLVEKIKNKIPKEYRKEMKEILEKNIDTAAQQTAVQQSSSNFNVADLVAGKLYKGPKKYRFS